MLITTQDALNDFMAEAANHPFLTVDTEFLREKTYHPKLCLIQIGTPDGKAAAIDPLSSNIDLDPVFAVLRDPNIIKIFHAARQDLEIFYKLMGEVPLPLFDTQIAAMVCGYGDQIGYDNLVRQTTGVQIDKTVQFTDWSRRPLSDHQIDYALGDVTHLVHAYEKLIAELDTRGRTQWVKEEDKILAAPETYQNDPAESWRRVKIKSNKPQVLAVLQAVAGWREERAQTKDIPRGWVMRDETLADMAAQAPTNTKQLNKIRNMPKDFPNSSGAQVVIDLIAAALKSDPATWPKKIKKKSLSPNAAACADILKMLLRVTAAECEVAARLIAPNDDIEAIAADDNADVMAMKGWRREVFGESAIALKNGSLALGFKDGEVVRYKTDGDSVCQQ